MKRKFQYPTDSNQLAKMIVDLATGETGNTLKKKQSKEKQTPKKAAVKKKSKK